MGKYRLDMNDLDISQDGIILEIGSEHGGGSTEKLYDYAEKNDIVFFTVDFDSQIINRLPKNIEGYNCTGQDFLRALFPAMDLKISFVYLDNFDYEFPEIKGKPFVKRQKKRYDILGVKMSNDASEDCHLEQAELCHLYRTNPFYIMMDDTYQRELDSEYEGKGAKVIPWALENGYTITESEKFGCNPWDGYVLLRHGTCKHESCLKKATEGALCSYHHYGPMTGENDG